MKWYDKLLDDAKISKLTPEAMEMMDNADKLKDVAEIKIRKPSKDDKSRLLEKAMQSRKKQKVETGTAEDDDYALKPRKAEHSYESFPKKVIEDAKIYNIVKKDSLFSISGIKERLKAWVGADKMVLINFELNSGPVRQFTVIERRGGFYYDDKFYVFDVQMKYYNFDAKMWSYDYHEDFALPVKKTIPIEDIKKSIELSGITDIEYATNPSTLERWLKAKIIEGIMKGASLDEWMKQVRVMVIIILFEVTIFLLIFIWKSGMLKNIKVPGLG